MTVLIKFLAQYELPIYLIFGLVALIYLRRLMISVAEKRSANYGVEREAAQRHVIQAMTVLILLAMLTVGEFVVATFLVGEISNQATYTEPTYTQQLSATTQAAIVGTPDKNATVTPTPFPQAQIEGISSHCVEGVLAFMRPAHNDTVNGVVELFGSVNTKNFGSYRYDYSTMGEPKWQTIAAGSGTRVDQSLGNWYTSDLVAGPYMLRLVALDNDGREQDACVIVVTVEE